MCKPLDNQEMTFKSIEEYTAEELSEFIKIAMKNGVINPPKPQRLFENMAGIVLPISEEEVTPELASAVVDRLADNNDAIKPLIMYWALLKKERSINDPMANEIFKIMKSPSVETLTDDELDMINYMLSQLNDGFIDISANHGDPYDRATCNLLIRILTEYRDSHNRKETDHE